MVRQWQDMIYDGHRSCTDLSDPMSDVKARDDQEVYLDFLAIAQGYRVRAERISAPEQLAAAFARMLAYPGAPYLAGRVGGSGSQCLSHDPGRCYLPRNHHE